MITLVRGISISFVGFFGFFSPFFLKKCFFPVASFFTFLSSFFMSLASFGSFTSIVVAPGGGAFAVGSVLFYCEILNIHTCLLCWSNTHFDSKNY